MATYQVTRRFELVVVVTDVKTATEASDVADLIDVRIVGDEPENVTVTNFADDGCSSTQETES